MPLFCTFTKYPKIYSASYWDSHSVHDTLPISDDIIFNRNELVEFFNLTSYAHKTTKTTQVQARILDGIVVDTNSQPVPLTVNNAHKFIGTELHRHHIEYYKCGRSTLAVFSLHTDEYEHALVLLNGYHQWKPLYDAAPMRTYLKVIHSVRDTTSCTLLPGDFLVP